MTITLKNLEKALAGESMAHIRYRYFAKLARSRGYGDIADHFEHTADQEILHAWSHLELLIGAPTVEECLNLAIAGETHEYTEMYPDFYNTAVREGNNALADLAQEQIAESREHAQAFVELLKKAEKRFGALRKVEQRHAQMFEQVKDTL